MRTSPVRPYSTCQGQLIRGAYLRAVEAAGETVRGGGLAQRPEGPHHRGAAYPVRVLPPGGHDQLQFVVHGSQLRGAQGAEVGVPVVAGLVVILTRTLAQPFELSEQ